MPGEGRGREEANKIGYGGGTDPDGIPGRRTYEGGGLEGGGPDPQRGGVITVT